MVSCDRIYKTKAYDKLEAFCDDEQGGDSCRVMADKYDRQEIVNLLIPVIRREEQKRHALNKTSSKKLIRKINEPYERCPFCNKVNDRDMISFRYRPKKKTPEYYHCNNCRRKWREDRPDYILISEVQ
jgi:hypothetical protein